MKIKILLVAVLISTVSFGQAIDTNSREIRQSDLYYGVSSTAFNFGTYHTIGARLGAWSSTNSVYDYNAAGIVFNRWLGTATSYSNAYVGQSRTSAGFGLSFDVSIENTKEAKPVQRMFISPNGKVGIGSSNPTEALQIGDTGFQFHNGGHKLIRFNPNTNNLASIRYDTDNKRFGFETTIDGVYKSHFLIAGNGNVLVNGKLGIGTHNPDAKLTVKGTVHCEEVLVDLDVPADYVFEKYYTGASELKENYTMPTLEEVAAYTKENHHLPNIPSAQEIQEEGLQLKEMTNLLLQKIEELTLYTIEQENRMKAQENRIQTLEKQLATK